MIAFSYFLLKGIICSAVLFCYYWLLLRNKVFHAYNRFYLLAIVLLSITLPTLKINIFNEPQVQQTNLIKILQIVTASDDFMDDIIIAPAKQQLTLKDMLPFLYLLISVLFFILFLQMFIKIRTLLKQYKSILIEDIHFVNTNAARGTPFSFLKYIFWNENIDMHSPTGSRIFRHEIAHIQERHTWDKLFINLVLIVFWSNPVFWVIRRELNMIHEFIADKKAVQDGDTAAFATMILAATYPQHSIAIANNFFYSPIKRRLAMITKNQHPRTNYISRLLVLPLAVLVFAAFTLKARHYNEPIKNEIKSNEINRGLTEIITVVIDAGHGGKEGGAFADDGTQEKDVTLALIKKIKALNTNDKINIILTREDDIYQDPRERAAFSQKYNADLFVSIHLDVAIKKNDDHSGLSIFTSNSDGDKGEKSKLFASVVIGQFKNNFKLLVANTAMQRHKGIWVLDANTVPAILIEAGYMSNKNDLAYLKSDEGQETFAKNILNAISNFAANKNIYKTNIDKGVRDTPPPAATILPNGNSISITKVPDTIENKELLKHPRITDVTIDLDNKYKPVLQGLILINGKEYNIEALNNKLIKGGTATFYKAGNPQLIKKLGEKARKGAMIIENAVVLEGTPGIEKYKNSLHVKMDSIYFVDASQRIKYIDSIKDGKVIPTNYSSALIVINGKISSQKALKDIPTNNIKDIKVLKGAEATKKYGKNATSGVIEINTKAAPIEKDNEIKIEGNVTISNP